MAILRREMPIGSMRVVILGERSRCDLNNYFSFFLNKTVIYVIAL